MIEYDNPFDYVAGLERSMGQINAVFENLPAHSLSNHIVDCMTHLVEARESLAVEIDSLARDKSHHLTTLFYDELNSIPWWQLRKRSAFNRNYYTWMFDKERELQEQAANKYH